MRGDHARLVDIVEICDQVITELGDDRERFENDAVLQAAAERWLTIIGEAAGRISEAFQHAHPEIPWREIIGMRNLLIHGYHHVEIDAVWEAITTGVPELRTAITDTLNNNPP